MTTRPPISVVVCTKNEEARLEDCLRSVVANHPDEIIVVDGGSTDRTLEIAARFTDRIISSPKSNLTLDRQRGIDAARHPLPGRDVHDQVGGTDGGARRETVLPPLL